MSLNMSYHNLDIVIKNLNIFKRRYIILRSIKVNQKRGIYFVHDTVDNRNKVLKFIIKTNVNDEQKNIFRFFMNCMHPNFCKINEIFKTGIFLVLVMDYVEGDTMCRYFEKKHNRANYYKIMFDLIFSLDYLHANKIVHGDIKPNNIIIKPDGTPVIIDYDLSRYVDGCRYTEKIFGTKIFMSPELIVENKFSTKSDVWSLGMTFYFCVMKSHVSNIPNSFSLLNESRCQKLEKNHEVKYYVNHTIKNVLETIAKNQKNINLLYGKLFANTISIMLIEEVVSRPSSEQLSNILQKSKYFPQLYNQCVGPDHIRYALVSTCVKSNVKSTHELVPNDLDSIQDEKHIKDNKKLCSNTRRYSFDNCCWNDTNDMSIDDMPIDHLSIDRRELCNDTSLNQPIKSWRSK